MNPFEMDDLDEDDEAAETEGLWFLEQLEEASRKLHEDELAQTREGARAPRMKVADTPES